MKMSRLQEAGEVLLERVRILTAVLPPNHPKISSGQFTY